VPRAYDACQIVGAVFPHSRECLEYIEGLAIFGTVAVVVLIAAIQEKDKENRFRALSAGSADEMVNVIRNGQNEKISVKEVVVGDTVVLSTGDIICADGICYERNTLSIFEGPLTGESHPIQKGQYEFKEDGTWEMPKDDDLKAFFPDSMTLDEMKAKFKPPPKKTPIIFAGTHVQVGCQYVCARPLSLWRDDVFYLRTHAQARTHTHAHAWHTHTHTHAYTRSPSRAGLLSHN
jgi:magnesium-transporting ATPase (P-type)